MGAKEALLRADLGRERATVDRLTGELAKCEEALQVALARAAKSEEEIASRGLLLAQAMDFIRGAATSAQREAWCCGVEARLALPWESRSVGECSALVPGDPSTCPREDCEECPVERVAQAGATLRALEVEPDAEPT